MNDMISHLNESMVKSCESMVKNDLKEFKDIIYTNKVHHPFG